MECLSHSLVSSQINQFGNQHWPSQCYYWQLSTGRIHYWIQARRATSWWMRRKSSGNIHWRSLYKYSGFYCLSVLLLTSVRPLWHPTDKGIYTNIILRYSADPKWDDMAKLSAKKGGKITFLWICSVSWILLNLFWEPLCGQIEYAERVRSRHAHD